MSWVIVRQRSLSVAHPRPVAAVSGMPHHGHKFVERVVPIALVLLFGRFCPLEFWSRTWCESYRCNSCKLC